MSRKLNVQELESRIAPSTGLASFLQKLSQTDSNAAALISQFVDANGNVNTGAAAGAANAAGLGSQVKPVSGSYTVTDKTVISDKTASMIMSLLGQK